jgi:hypothetical protein
MSQLNLFANILNTETRAFNSAPGIVVIVLGVVLLPALKANVTIALDGQLASIAENGIAHLPAPFATCRQAVAHLLEAFSAIELHGVPRSAASALCACAQPRIRDGFAFVGPLP